MQQKYSYTVSPTASCNTELPRCISGSLLEATVLQRQWAVWLQRSCYDQLNNDAAKKTAIL
jgi:hypothetical protein